MPKTAGTKEQLLVGIKRAIRGAFNEHSYLNIVLERKIQNEVNPVRKKDLKDDYDLFRRLSDIDGNPSIDDIDTSIRFLSKLLYDYFGTEVYLLIDEFDAPLFTANSEKFHNYILDRISLMLEHGSKNNEFVKKTILTGILSSAKRDYLPSLNYLCEYSVLDEDFVSCFGFDQNEVNILIGDALENCPQINKKNILKEIKRWYLGYNMGRRTLYNTWSIVNCIVGLKEAIDSKGNIFNAIDSYWIGSGSSRLAENVYLNSKQNSAIEKFLEKDEVLLDLSKSVKYKDGVFLESTLSSLLLYTGYITISEKDPEYARSVAANFEYTFSKIEDNEKEVEKKEDIVKKEILCKIPNLEIKDYFINRLIELWGQKRGLVITRKNIERLREANVEDYANYKKVIKDVLLPTATEEQKIPDFCALLTSQYYFFGYKPTNHTIDIDPLTDDAKRVNIVFKPIEGKSQTGIVHEYKLQDKTKLSVETMVENALWQIFVKKYMKKIFSIECTKNVIIRAVVFYKEYGEWNVKIKEHKLSIISAKKLDNEAFYELKKDLNIELLNEELFENRGDARKKFLRKFKVKSLDALIEKYSKTDN